MRSISCLYRVQSPFLRLMEVLCRAGDEVAVVCNPIRMGRWSELMVVCDCHSDEVMREADAKDTSGELGSPLIVYVFLIVYMLKQL